LRHVLSTSRYLGDDAGPVATEADSTISLPTYAVTDLQHIGGNTTENALTVTESFRDLFVSPEGAVD
jgi:hypothetical protein